jgi:hypothetical protein
VGRLDVAGEANVLQDDVESITQRDQLTPRQLGPPLRPQQLNHLRKPGPLSIARRHAHPVYCHVDTPVQYPSLRCLV